MKILHCPKPLDKYNAISTCILDLHSGKFILDCNNCLRLSSGNIFDDILLLDKM